MICQICAEAAGTVADWIEVFAPEDTWIVAMAEKHHQKCQGCDCQHDVDYQIKVRPRKPLEPLN